MLDLIAFPDHSRVWIYSSDRLIPDEKIPEIHHEIQKFVKDWTSHQEELVASGGILHNYFIVLVVDENKNPPGGCSIDKSVHFVQKLAERNNVDFFNRKVVHYIQNEEVLSILLDELPNAYSSGNIQDATLFFNPLVNSKSEFIKNWLVPLQQSWIKRFA